MDTRRETRHREEEWENSWRRSREDCYEGIESRVPESKGSTMSLTLFKSKLWVKNICTIEMMAEGRKEGGKS